MAKKTPPLLAKGRYTLVAPWVANPNMLYTCMAIRAFEDIYKLGYDVQTIYYHSRGLVDGSIITSPAFVFATERTKQPNIITLVGDDGSVIYVPDTFIASYPNLSEVKYSHMVLSVSLGALPDYLDLNAVKAAVSGLVAQTTGVTPTVLEHRVPSTENPTAAQHETLEVTRLAAITLLETDHAKVLRLQAEKTLLQAKINTLVQILQTNNLLP